MKFAVSGLAGRFTEYNLGIDCDVYKCLIWMIALKLYYVSKLSLSRVGLAL